MKRILHYVGSMNHGGMENLIMNVYRNINRNHYQFDFAVHTEEKADMDDEIISFGGRIIPFPQFRKNPLHYRKTWDRFWSENNKTYDVFHFHTDTLANIQAIRSALKHNVRKIIIHAHSASTNKGWLQKVHNLIHYKNQIFIANIDTKHIILASVSDEASQWVFGEKLFMSDRIQKIQNGVDYQKYYFDNQMRDSIRKQLNISSDDIILGHTGTFVEVKNHKKIIQVFKKLVHDNGRYKLMLIGGGPLLPSIKQLACDLDLDDRILFLGNLAEVYRYLSAMDVFIFPSLYEGLPLSLIESQINELPILASDAISKEVKISEKLFFMSVEKPHEQWAEKICELSKMDRHIDRNMINKKFDIKNTVEQFEAMYQ